MALHLYKRQAIPEGEVIEKETMDKAMCAGDSSRIDVDVTVTLVRHVQALKYKDPVDAGNRASRILRT